MEATDDIPTDVSSLPLLIDPSGALLAARRLEAACPAGRRHSAILGRLVNAAEAERLDRQRDDDLRRHARVCGSRPDESVAGLNRHESVCERRRRAPVFDWDHEGGEAVVAR
jgi:hypothetical protein